MNSFLWGERKVQRGNSAWSYRLHIPTHPLQDAATGSNGDTVKCWTPNIKPAPSTESSKQLHESTLHPSFTFRKTRTQSPASPPICALSRVQFAPNHLFGGKIPQTIQTFSSEMPSSSDYMRAWKHFPKEKQAVLSWNRILPWILRAAPSHSNWRLTQLLSHAQQSEDQLVSSAKDSEEHLQMTTQTPSTH